MQLLGAVRSRSVRWMLLAGLLGGQMMAGVGGAGAVSGPGVAHAAASPGGGSRLAAVPQSASLHSASVEAASAQAPMCFSETGFCIVEPAFQTYFTQRGGTRILGFPISREFTLDGFSVQFFQRVILQLQGGGVSRLNVLDPGLMPILQANGSTFPPPDSALAAMAPSPDDPNYSDAVVTFVHNVAPDSVGGQNVGFFQLFNTTVPVDLAFPGGAPNPGLVTLLNLEIWGLPTSKPTADPNNSQFIYQRFQRGIMHYSAACPCTQGILVGDYFKSVITGRDLPADLGAGLQGSRYYGQYAPGNPRWLTRPGDLSNSDLTGAFEAGSDPPQVKPRIRLSSSDLAPLASVLARDGLGPQDVNTARTTSFLAPGGAGVVSSIAPLTRPPSGDASDLQNKDGGVPIGVLQAARTLPLSQANSSAGGPQARLASDIYLVRVRKGRVELVGSDGRHTVTGLAADVRGMDRWIGPPQSTFTYKDACFSWNLVQVCTAPSPLDGFTAEERQAGLKDPMNRAVASLKGKLPPNVSIHVDATVFEAEGEQAVAKKQASLLAAPVDGPEGPQRETPADGAVLGVIQAVLPIDVPGSPSVAPGAYVVRAAASGPGQWVARLTAADGRQVDLPARALEVRGGVDEPLAVVANLCFFGNDLCLFDEVYP